MYESRAHDAWLRSAMQSTLRTSLLLLIGFAIPGAKQEETLDYLLLPHETRCWRWTLQYVRGYISLAEIESTISGLLSENQGERYSRLRLRPKARCWCKTSPASRWSVEGCLCRSQCFLSRQACIRCRFETHSDRAAIARPANLASWL